jgi:formylglycine-generating enzyme
VFRSLASFARSACRGATLPTLAHPSAGHPPRRRAAFLLGGAIVLSLGLVEGPPVQAGKKAGHTAAKSGKDSGKKSAGRLKETPSAGPRGAGKKGEPAGKGRHGTGKKGKKRRKGRGSQPDSEPRKHTPSLPILSRSISCPEDMVAVAGRVCVDRYEATLVEHQTGELLSPYYPPSHKLAASLYETWQKNRADDVEGSVGHEMPIPELTEAHRGNGTGSLRAHAMSWPYSTPAGYTSGEMARDACAAAGKRLCSLPEWVTACRGERQTTYPYGDRYIQNACNVFRDEHPAHLLHGAFSTGLLDPRLNQVDYEGKPLLQPTGASERCQSRWGDDAVYDMVGNVDEWTDDPDGTFVGGFYSRATRNGCDARVSSHAVSYFDYSIGVRCCKDPEPSTP